jgi:D-aspartate ligase
MPSSDVPALVFGEGVTGLAVVRSLGRAGVPVFVAGSNTALVRRSRWFVPAPGEALDETSDGARVARYLESLPFERAVVFACNDEWTLAMGSLPSDISASYATTAAPLPVLRMLVDKGVFADCVDRFGVPAPRTLHVSGAEDLAALSDSEISGFFIKPRSSQLFSQRFGVKALRLAGRRDAAQLVSRVADEGLEVLLQEFIPSPPMSHVFLDGYVDRDGVMRACLARRRLRMHPPEFGNSTMSVTVPLSEVTPAVESLRHLLDGIGYTGLFDAEYVHDERDGVFKILEVNARPWWQLELAGFSGLDLVSMAYRDALGLPVPPAPRYQVGRTWVHPIPDLKAWWGLVRGGGDVVGGFPLWSWFRGANALFTRDDPGPAAEELGRLARRVLRGRRPKGAPRLQAR